MRTRASDDRSSSERTVDPGAVVAPGEVREMIARLTQQSIEAVTAHEARTLEALALETGIPVLRLRETLAAMRRQGRFAVPPAAWFGFAFLALFAYWVVAHPPPGQSLAPVATLSAPAVPKVEPDLSDTVPITSVTYGPDSGTFSVDPAFVAPRSLPEGLSVSAIVGQMVWGVGDHRAKAITGPLTKGEEAALRDDVESLLRYVRADAERRRLALLPGARAFLVMLSAQAYGGSSGSSVKLPPPGAADDARAEAAIRRAADDLVEMLQAQFRQQERWRREQGP